MLHFDSDYMQGACPQILQRLAETNQTQFPSYGITQAERIRAALKAKGYTPYIPSPTNQTFVVLENEKIAQLEQQVSMGFWEKYDDEHTVMRFATSWATRPEDVDALVELL